MTRKIDYGAGLCGTKPVGLILYLFRFFEKTLEGDSPDRFPLLAAFRTISFRFSLGFAAFFDGIASEFWLCCLGKAPFFPSFQLPQRPPYELFRIAPDLIKMLLRHVRRCAVRSAPENHLHHKRQEILPFLGQIIKLF